MMRLRGGLPVPKRWIRQHRRFIHISYKLLKDQEDSNSTSQKPPTTATTTTTTITSWPTAESVILQRISSTAVHPSLDYLNKEEQEQEQEDDTKEEATEETQKDKKETESPSEEKTISSVTGIINSVRETRAASNGGHSNSYESTSNHINHQPDEERISGSCLFDTYGMVSQLTEAGFARGQATAIMAVTKRRVEQGMDRVRASMLTKSDLENDAYLFRAALQELRTEMQMVRKNDQSLLESQAAAISREIESLGQRTNDQIANLRSDIEIEMNNHKHDTSHEMKAMDVELHELATKYQVLMGEMKTDIEAIKLDSIRRGLLAVVLTAGFLSAVYWGPKLYKKVMDKDAVVDEENGKMVASRPTREEIREAAAAMNTAPTPSSKESQRSVRRRKRLEKEQNRPYRSHSHLNIRYDPTTTPVEDAEDNEDNYDDWFDSYFYANPDAEPASLMDADARVDSTFWETKKEKEEPATTPLHYTYSDQGSN